MTEPKTANPTRTATKAPPKPREAPNADKARHIIQRVRQTHGNPVHWSHIPGASPDRGTDYEVHRMTLPREKPTDVVRERWRFSEFRFGPGPDGATIQLGRPADFDEIVAEGEWPAALEAALLERHRGPIRHYRLTIEPNAPEEDGPSDGTWIEGGDDDDRADAVAEDMGPAPDAGTAMDAGGPEPA